MDLVNIIFHVHQTDGLLFVAQCLSILLCLGHYALTSSECTCSGCRAVNDRSVWRVTVLCRRHHPSEHACEHCAPKTDIRWFYVPARVNIRANWRLESL